RLVRIPLVQAVPFPRRRNDRELAGRRERRGVAHRRADVRYAPCQFGPVEQHTQRSHHAAVVGRDDFVEGFVPLRGHLLAFSDWYGAHGGRLLRSYSCAKSSTARATPCGSSCGKKWLSPGKMTWRKSR